MKKVFSGEVYEVLPISNGIIFSYCKDVVDQSTVVAYKMITFDNGRFTDIAKNIYLLTKFGNNYKAVAAICDNYITAKSIVLPNSKVFLLSADGEARLLGADALPVWTGELKYRGCNATDIALYKNALWARLQYSSGYSRTFDGGLCCFWRYACNNLGSDNQSCTSFIWC